MSTFISGLNTLLLLMNYGAVLSWKRRTDELYWMEVDLKKTRQFRNPIRAVCYGHHKKRYITISNTRITIYRVPPIKEMSWDDPCSSVNVMTWENQHSPDIMDWDLPCTTTEDKKWSNISSKK